MAARRKRAYVGLGANLPTGRGGPEATLGWAVAALGARDGIRVRAVSPLYATAPWGVADQPEFRNAVVAIDVTIEPLALLGVLKALEREAGRVDGERWGPRILDLDLLVYGRQRLALERTPEARSLDADTDPSKAARLLEVPHRDLGDRLFVLAPLADLAAGLVPPGWHQTIATRLRAVAARDGRAGARRLGTWDDAVGRWVSPG